MAQLLGGLILAAAPILVNAATRGARMYTVRYGPQVANEGAQAVDAFAKASHAKREFVRRNAVQNFAAVPDAEYRRILASDPTLDDLHRELCNVSDGDAMRLIDAIRDDLEGHSSTRQRPIRIGYQTIRMSRDWPGIEAIGDSIPFFSHWYLEIGSITYELRDARSARQAGQSQNGRVVVYEEVGESHRHIKLVVVANRVHHEKTRFLDVGTTSLTNAQIMKLVSLIFRKFACDYDVWLDNCQHFAALLAEKVGGEENRESIRRSLQKKSLLPLNIAASWVSTPAYHMIAALDFALNNETDVEILSDFRRRTRYLLENFEKFYYHPRLYAARQ